MCELASFSHNPKTGETLVRHLTLHHEIEKKRVEMDKNNPYIINTPKEELKLGEYINGWDRYDKERYQS
ncbi:MAG: hypothetical protein WC375_12540 [Methanomassiliicoccales archaeon]|jgi:hypothetical protein